MQKHPELTLQRVQNFASERALAGQFYPEKAPVQMSVFRAPGRIPYAEAAQGEYIPTNLGQSFGPAWSTHWFKVEIKIPESWAGQEVHFLWDSGTEAEVWEDGKPMQGLAGSGGGWQRGVVRGEYILIRKAKGAETRTLYIEMAVNSLFGAGTGMAGTVRQAEIGVFDREAWELFWDLKVIADMAEELGNNNPRGAQALFAANQMVNLIRYEDRETWKAAREVARTYFSCKTGEGQMDISAIGHAHLDTAWLWPLAETQRKAVRTFSTALLNMDEYPDYIFVCSQAQQYEWIKDSHPDLWKRIQERVKDGRFIPAGGSWVEPDCNLPSGEALVRQFLYGQRFFRKEFGMTCEEFWEPDVFGYSAALPQILRGVGMKYFLTIKLSWNQFNKLSAHSFIWEGLDGSRVLTHFPPADTYNSHANVKEVLFSQTNYKDLDRSRNAYLLFGYGDGGGGPTRGMLEQIDRMHNVDGLPRVNYRTPNQFFHRLEADIKDPMVWVGELYFELHRGTYTTQARNKLYNRRSEFLLHEVEFLSALAHTLKGAEYPQADLDRMWKMVLTNQFHDIIPGSSIREVYSDSDESYHDVLGASATLRNQAAVALTGKPETSGQNILAWNTLGVDRHEVVSLPEGARGTQQGADGKPVGIASAPPYGYTVAAPGQSVTPPVRVVEQDGQITLENDFVRAVFASDGSLTSFYDKHAEKESVEPGKAANRFVLFDDNPNAWDAWDVDIFHLEKPLDMPGAKSARVIERGPLRAALEFEYEVPSSGYSIDLQSNFMGRSAGRMVKDANRPNTTIKQTVYLTAISPRLDFHNLVSWHEQHKILKVEFPFNLYANAATYEVQFGYLQRPTHWNTSWDMARFEVVAHRWADLSEPDFGVALLNDSKYGHSVHENIMRLSLLRSPISPDPEADQGEHHFRYALLPHAGLPQNAGVIEEALRFNVPMQISPTDRQGESQSFFSVDNPAIILDTVKKAEDSDGIIVRMYEARGTRGTATLKTALPVKSAVQVNLLEDEEEKVDWNDGLTFTFRPFEIKTYLLK